VTGLADIGQGALLGLSAAATPGPFQALLVARAARAGPARALPLALVPIASDGPAIAVVLAVLTQLPPGFLTALRVLGTGLVLVLAALTLRGALRPAARPGPTESSRGFVQVALVNLTNPNMWMFWSAVGGPILAADWQAGPARALAFLAGFYACISAGNAVLIGAAGAISGAGPRAARALGLASGAALVAFGAWQGWRLFRG
jgi:threonine/homoserine/homoserine lactone efflux protein